LEEGNLGGRNSAGNFLAAQFLTSRQFGCPHARKPGNGDMREDAASALPMIFLIWSRVAFDGGELGLLPGSWGAHLLGICQGKPCRSSAEASNFGSQIPD
jgi:hypothetical protein